MNRNTLVLFSILAAIATQACPGDDWNLWRGPNCDGRIEAPGYFPNRPYSLEVVWKQKVGSAYSSVSIVDRHILTMFNEGNSDYLARIELQTGNEVWRHRVGAIYKAHDGGHDGPVSTPVADKKHVYALGPRGRLFAVESANGNEAWSIHLVKKYGAKTPFWGFASTPIIFRDLLIVQVGGQGDHGIIGFDKSTGELRWQRSFGRTEYRSPVLANVEGKVQLIASDSSQTIGINPQDGELLWRYGGGIDNSKTPLYLGDGKILLMRRGAELIELDSNNASAKRVWRTSEFRSNYDVASFHDGCLFGFTGRYLTCLDLETGNRLWRSRQPGGKGLIVVDEHLIVLGDHGDVVVSQANRQGYLEKARVNVSDGAAYSWPCFADGLIVVRNLKHMAALKPSTITKKVEQKPETSAWFNQFIARVEKSKDKFEIVDEFLRQHPQTPIIEDEKFVHFVYRGEAKDVGILGTMLASGEQDSMLRVAGTDLFYRTYEIEPGANWEYQFIVDFDKRIPDPRNTSRSFNDSRMSELFTESWNQSKFANPVDGIKKGRVSKMRFDSSIPEFSSDVVVYQPHNYKNESKHDLIVVLDGSSWLEEGRSQEILDHVFDSREATAVVAFVNRVNEAELGGWRTSAYSAVIAKELVPQLQKRIPD